MNVSVAMGDIGRAFSMTVTEQGFALSAFFIPYMLMQVPAGWLASAQTLSIFTDSTPAMLFFSIFGLCALGLATANHWALTQTLIPGGAVGTMVGIQNTAASLAGVVAPSLTGWVISSTGSFETPIKAIGVWLAIGIAAYVFLVRPKFAPLAANARVGV